MLLFLVVSIILQLAVATRFFDRCSMDREQRVDNDQVFNVLHAFYNDLIFVQAITESPEGQDLEKVIEEMRNVVPTDSLCQQITEGIELLRIENFRAASDTLVGARNTELISSVPYTAYLRSYLHYFLAEAFRLDGYLLGASEEISYATSERIDSEGISLNELERLKGLILIQRVSEFNQNIDRLYGLETSPNSEQLQLAHSDLKGEIDPFNDLRPAELRRMFGSNRRITQALGRREIGAFRPSQRPREDDSETPDYSLVPGIFNGRSIAKTSAEDILCEFARKLAIFVHGSREDGGTDYSSLIDEMRQIDSRYAERFDKIVVQNLVTNPQRNSMVRLELFESHFLLDIPRHIVRKLKIYRDYFEAEIIRSAVGCGDMHYAEILLDDIKSTRHSKRGVSLGKVLELEGRIVIKLMKCFRNQLISVYELDGGESNEELKDKRSRFGTCERRFPST